MNFFVFKQTAKKYLKINRRKKRFVSYEKARDFLLLFESENWEYQQIAEIVSVLEKDNKHVMAIGYTTGKKPLEKSMPDILLFSKKETNLFGKPAKNIIEKVAKGKFDILIDLSSRQAMPLLYLSLYADASLKMSSHMLDMPIFDFILDIHKQKENKPEQNNDAMERFLFEEIIFYLKSIQTTD